MKVQRYDGAADFRGAALPFLVRQEAENNLILGVSAALLGGEYRQPPYLATVRDAGGEMVLAALRTPPRNLLLSTVTAGTDSDTALQRLSDDLQALYGDDLPGINGPKPLAHAFAAIWTARTGGASAVAMRQRIYKLTELTPPQVPGHLRAATESDRVLLTAWAQAFYDEALAEEVEGASGEVFARFALDPARSREAFLWVVDGVPVSLAGFGGPTPNGLRVGPVYTPPAHRRNGYGAAATAGVTRVAFRRGRTMAFLYTDLDNPTSNKIYQQIGYRPVLDVDMLRFD